ncbi:MAG: hypothetical protein A2008_02845 [Candidatus Wallbacteria bacterium GWC2_49_35]|uniref:Membrane protein insertase YidC n=1 Tax=Candidatus Wallbacteria bacterium GWC2_49_35 TaxID=1817813 RepID=A0A1F7WL46_9BACT|nr:MAG: hypothetical protein A2008_02845 [Candidatus Wallbacteria bacterium GWC2_49_35]HBC73386.1 hypothetical protein [Candidatus Wallbacteria bacterium]
MNTGKVKIKLKPDSNINIKSKAPISTFLLTFAKDCGRALPAAVIFFTAAVILAAPFSACAQTPVPAAAEVSTAGPNDVTVKTGDFEIIFSKEGACLKSYKLTNPKFRDDFALDASALQTAETPVSKPFELELYAAGESAPVTIVDGGVLYDLKQEKTGTAEKLLFTATIAAGAGKSVTVAKTYTVDHAQKLIKFSVKIKNSSASPLNLSDQHNIGFAINFLPNIGKNSHDDELIANFGGSLYKAIVSSDEYKYDFKTADTNITRWIAIRDSYYAAIIAFDDKKPASAYCGGVAGGALKDGMGFASEFKIKYPAFSIDEGESENFNFTMFLGVKTYDELKKFNKGFEDICELNFLALLILQSLFFFYGITKSYGLSIILLTVAIKLLLQPLTNKQTKSMKDMQKIQPHIAELKKKYPDNMQKQNEEVMKLYKEHGINPFSGCLPLLLQLPILFALFTALRSSVELKGEGFLWLADLSMADPTWILPIAIALSMHIQQSQMQVDPNQAAAMQFMPIFMFFITYTLPAGVLLYWGVSNVLQVGQQWYDKRKDAPLVKVGAAGRPAADEKAEGSAKTQKGGEKV